MLTASAGHSGEYLEKCIGFVLQDRATYPEPVSCSAILIILLKYDESCTRYKLPALQMCTYLPAELNFFSERLGPSNKAVEYIRALLVCQTLPGPSVGVLRSHYGELSFRNSGCLLALDLVSGPVLALPQVAITCKTRVMRLGTWHSMEQYTAALHREQRRSSAC